MPRFDRGTVLPDVVTDEEFLRVGSLVGDVLGLAERRDPERLLGRLAAGDLRLDVLTVPDGLIGPGQESDPVISSTDAYAGQYRRNVILEIDGQHLRIFATDFRARSSDKHLRTTGVLRCLSFVMGESGAYVPDAVYEPVTIGGDARLERLEVGAGDPADSALRGNVLNLGAAAAYWHIVARPELKEPRSRQNLGHAVKITSAR